MRYYAEFRIQIGVDWHVPLAGGRLAFDETREYVRAEFDLPYDEGYFGLLAPEAEPARIIVEALGADAFGQDRGTVSADLHIRDIDGTDRSRMRFVATSDEGLLSDYSVMDENYQGLIYESGIRGAVDAVLDLVIPGAHLEVSPYNNPPIVVLDSDNLVKNPSLDVDRSDWLFWTNGGGGDSFRMTGFDNLGGPAFFRGVFAGATSSPAAGPYYIVEGVTERVVYSGSVWMRPSKATVLRFGVEFKDRDGVTLDVAVGPAVACPADTWTRIYHDVSTAPVGAVAANVTMYGIPGTSPNWAADDRIDAKALRFGPILSSPLTWSPGVTAWDYLMSLVATVGLRLFCDETRAWRLVEKDWSLPASGPIKSRLTIPLTELAELRQTVSRDSPQGGATGVVIRYEWEGADGIVRRKADRAGTPGKVKVIDIRRPYPGAGAAQLHLDRLQNQHMQYELAIAARFDVRPSQPVEVKRPDYPYPDFVQRIQSMEYSMDDGSMRVRARGISA